MAVDCGPLVRELLQTQLHRHLSVTTKLGESFIIKSVTRDGKSLIAKVFDPIEGSEINLIVDILWETGK